MLARMTGSASGWETLRVTRELLSDVVYLTLACVVPQVPKKRHFVQKSAILCRIATSGKFCCQRFGCMLLAIGQGREAKGAFEFPIEVSLPPEAHSRGDLFAAQKGREQ